MDKDDIISTLNDLIQTCKDGAEGFRDCATNVKEAQLRSLFENRAQSCDSSASELQELVRGYGGDPETKSSMTGTLHRRWIDIKTAISGQDEQAVLSECERGEDVAVRRYRAALDKVLPPEVRSIVERQYQGTLRNHDQVKALRDRTQASRNLGNP